MSQLDEGARTIVNTCMKVRKNEEVLIFTDEPRLEISRVISEAAHKITDRVTEIILTDEIRPVICFNEIHKAAISKADVVLTPFEGIPAETPFRLSLIDYAVKNKARLGHMPGVEKRMLIDGGLKGDYNEVKKTSASMIKKLKNKTELHITAPGGTDLTVKLGKRKWIQDNGLYHKPGIWGNLPAGEIFIAPLENGVDGRLVVDGSIGFFGLPRHPIDIQVQRGRIISITCNDKKMEKTLKDLIFKETDQNAQIVGELGIGTNRFARLTGNLLEDEKVFDTAHIAFGDNNNMGGKNKSKIHIDMIFKKPEIE